MAEGEGCGMLDDNFVPKQEGKWRFEELARFGRWLLIVYHDEQVRGQIEFFDKEELQKCLTLLEGLNQQIKKL